MARPRKSPEDMLTYAELAAEVGVSPSTLRSYASRRQARLPDPDGRVGQSPFWKRSTVAPWVRQAKAARARSAPRG